MSSTKEDQWDRLGFHVCLTDLLGLPMRPDWALWESRRHSSVETVLWRWVFVQRMDPWDSWKATSFPFFLSWWAHAMTFWTFERKTSAVGPAWGIRNMRLQKGMNQVTWGLTSMRVYQHEGLPAWGLTSMRVYKHEGLPAPDRVGHQVCEINKTCLQHCGSAAFPN